MIKSSFTSPQASLPYLKLLSFSPPSSPPSLAYKVSDGRADYRPSDATDWKLQAISTDLIPDPDYLLHTCIRRA